MIIKTNGYPAVHRIGSGNIKDIFLFENVGAFNDRPKPTIMASEHGRSMIAPTDPDEQFLYFETFHGFCGTGDEACLHLSSAQRRGKIEDRPV